MTIPEEGQSELEAIAKEIGLEPDALRQFLGLSDRGGRYPAALTPAQKDKIDTADRDGTLCPVDTRDSNGRSASSASRRPSRAAKRVSIGHNTLRKFKTRSPDPTARATRTEEARQAERLREADQEALLFLRQPSLMTKAHRKLSRREPSPPAVRHNRPLLSPEEFSRQKGIALRAFPPRMQLPIRVCDIKKDNAIIHKDRLKNIEEYWKKKPDDVLVRWIHAPLGMGVVHSSIEDMFLHDQPPGLPFHETGPPEFPFLDLDSLHFRATKELKYMREVRDTLYGNADLTKTLTKGSIGDHKNESFDDDLKWRLKHLGKYMDFWDNAMADVPLELTERFSSGGGEGPLRPATVGTGPLDPSTLEKEDVQFRDAHMVWAPFRCFHRQDGILLTMSAGPGVDLLDRDFQEHIHETVNARLDNPTASVIASVMRSLVDNGAKDWYHVNVEYFLVHLVTEIGVTPDNLLSGRAASSILSALQSINRSLKTRRYQRWVPKESAELVKDYIIFQDELRALSTVLERKVAFFEKLATDVRTHEDDDRNTRRGSVDRASRIHNPNGETSATRVKVALKFNKGQKAAVDALLLDTSRSIEPLFQLSTIEQNDLAITNEKRNKAILIFTAVTVVFLPLSFFSSYWGTNFVGVRNTDLTQRYFWKVGGSLTVLIVLFLCLVAFWSRIVAFVVEVARFRPRNRGMHLHRRRNDLEAFDEKDEKGE